MNNAIQGPLGPLQVVSLGWKQFVKNLTSILMITLIVFVPLNILYEYLNIMSLEDSSRVFFEFSALFMTVIGMVVIMAVAKMIESSLLGEVMPWHKALQHGVGHLWAAIKTNILGALIVFGLTLLFVIPGIIWALYYSLTNITVSLRGISGRAGLSYSKAIVKGQWWRTLGYFLVIFMVQFVIVIFFIGVAIPLMHYQPIAIGLGSLLDLILFGFGTSMFTVFFLNNEAFKKA